MQDGRRDASAQVQALDVLVRPMLNAMYNSQAIENDKLLRGAVDKMKPKDNVLFINKVSGKAMISFDFEPPPAE